MPLRRRTSLKTSLRAIERAFAEIEKSLAQLATRVRRAEHEAGRKMQVYDVGARLRRRLKLTPKRRAQLKLQGAYVGYMRQLGSRQKTQVKAVKAKRGFEAAIRLAKRIARRSR